LFASSPPPCVSPSWPPVLIRLLFCGNFFLSPKPVSVSFHRSPLHVKFRLERPFHLGHSGGNTGRNSLVPDLSFFSKQGPEFIGRVLPRPSPFLFLSPPLDDFVFTFQCTIWSQYQFFFPRRDKGTLPLLRLLFPWDSAGTDLPPPVYTAG